MPTNLDLTKLGSPSALSLLANSETIPSLVTAGAVLAVTAAFFTYSEYKNYQEKKHKKEIENVNELYSLHLKQMIVPSQGKIHGFPPIFQLVDNKYHSMHFTSQQVKDIGSDVIHGTDIALSNYRESVRATIKKLQEYYFSRKNGKKVKSDDIGAGVLSYLMYMLDTKCLNFLGYEYDIAYLDAICKFINAYASQHGEKSQRFSRLSPVYMHLLKAKQKLEKHKEVLSLEETVAELKDSCINYSDILIRTLVKMVVKDSDTDLADTVAHNELKEGVLRQHYIRSEILEIELCADTQINIPDSIFKDWIKKLSTYYLHSLSTELENEKEQFDSPDDFFIILNLANQLLGKKLSRNSKEQVKIENELKRIRKVFKESGNFISTRFNKTTKKFEIVSDPLSLVERSLIMGKIAKIAHELVSLQYLSAFLLKSIQLLGDIYVNNPEHFCQIFHVLERLCTLIQEDSLAAKKAFMELQQGNDNNMQLEEKERFPNTVRDILESIYGEIKNFGEQIKESRQIAIKTIQTRTVKSVKYEMLGIANGISQIYFGDTITTNNEEKTFPSAPSEIPENNELDLPAQPINTEQENKDSLIDSLNKLSSSLFKSVWEIQKYDFFRSKSYFLMYDALSVMKNKSLMLLQENSSVNERRDKAEKTLALTVFLFNETIAFLNKSTTERQSFSANFYNLIHDKLNNQENNNFIDRHNNKVSRFIYTHICSYGIFKTDTRKKLDIFEDLCKKTSLT
ncbi:hypothetical protein Lsan_4143 [Legionella santicrucis]|uniref:Uncharacterized protein n=1 Tax=Legionella santicrucis TaxID=45074 RepID=A0A0W0YA01_9GAMM|nr:hypothetical protein [Legionella santicrucis]KTD53733.1 hypothetical protein Lsan_4143 [Legionella santicrucis]